MDQNHSATKGQTMRKTLTMAIAAVMALGMLVAPATQAAKKKPVKTALYLHGASQVGEADIPQTWREDKWHSMDKNKPSTGAPKSMFVTNYVVGPNTECSGNGLVPTWRGNLTGTVKGTATATFHTVATPGARITVDLYPDGNGGCNGIDGTAEYVPPEAQQIVDVPAGQGKVEVKFPNLNFKTRGSLVMMVAMAPGTSGVLADPVQVRILYDSAEFASSLNFKCIPAKGKACTF